MRFVHLGDGTRAGDPGVVDQHVQAAQALGRRGHQPLYVGSRGDVRAYGDRFAAAGREAIRRCRNGALVHIGKHDRGPLPHEQLGHRQTQPRPAPVTTARLPSNRFIA